MYSCLCFSSTRYGGPLIAEGEKVLHGSNIEEILTQFETGINQKFSAK